MKRGVMLKDIFRSLCRRTATRQYPIERHPAPERLRGQLHFNPSRCTGCRLCSKDCPANAIEIFMVDKASKRFVGRYHLDRCTFCGQCVLSCPQDALRLSNDEWELAATNRQPFTIYYGDNADVERVLVGLAESPAGSSEEK